MKYPGWILNFTQPFVVSLQVILNLDQTFLVYKWRKCVKISKKNLFTDKEKLTVILMKLLNLSS